MLLVLKPAPSSGLLGLFHDPKHTLFALSGFFPQWLEGFLLLQQLRALPQ